MVRESTVVATLDRIERDNRGNDLAVLVFDGGEQLTLPVARLPEGSREGSVLSVTFQLDIDESRRRGDQVRDLQSRLFQDTRDPDEGT